MTVTVQMKLSTILRLLNAFKQLVVWTAADGKTLTNWFGLDQIRVARNIKACEYIESIYINEKNNLVRSYLVGSENIVREEFRADLEAKHETLLESLFDITLHKMDYKNLQADGNKINAYSLGVLLDLIENIEE